MQEQREAARDGWLHCEVNRSLVQESAKLGNRVILSPSTRVKEEWKCNVKRVSSGSKPFLQPKGHKPSACVL